MTAITITLVVAVADNGVIGRGGDLPWRMPSDLKAFKAATLGRPVVMGRKTFQSLGRPLPGRDNIVVSRDPSFASPGIEVAPSLDAALDLARAAAGRRGVTEVAVIGGAEIYRAALPLADQVLLTRIHATPDGDATFPGLDPADWDLVATTPLAVGAGDDHAATTCVYRRRAG